MAGVSLVRGTTSKRRRIFIQDNSVVTGAGLTGLLFNSSGLTWYYIRDDQGATVQVTLATMTLGTWTTGGFIEIDAVNMPGWYEIGVPNAALVSGASVQIHLQGATNMVPVVLDIELTGWDNQNATTGGLTNLDATITSRTKPADTQARVTLVDTVTTYTGNTPQTGDNYARIGAAGAGLTALGDTRIAHLDADISSRSTYAGSDTSGVTTLLSRVPGTVQPQTGDSYARLGAAGAGLTALGDARIANLDATISSRTKPADTQARVTLVDTVTTYTGNTPQTGDSYARLGAPAGASISADIAEVEADLDVVVAASSGDPWSISIPASYAAGTAGYIVGTNLDAAVSSRSTYAGGAVASVTGDLGGKVLGGGAGVIVGVGVQTHVEGLAVGVAYANFKFIMRSSTNHITPTAGLTITAQRSIDGGAFAACTNAVVEIANGAYRINLSASDLTGTSIMLYFTAAGADPVFIILKTVA